MLKVHPMGVACVSNTADTLAVVLVKGAGKHTWEIQRKNIEKICKTNNKNKKRKYENFCIVCKDDYGKKTNIFQLQPVH